MFAGVSSKKDTRVGFSGVTALLIDLSGSMDVSLSKRSEMTRIDAHRRLERFSRGLHSGDGSTDGAVSQVQ